MVKASIEICSQRQINTLKWQSSKAGRPMSNSTLAFSTTTVMESIKIRHTFEYRLGFLYHCGDGVDQDISKGKGIL